MIGFSASRDESGACILRHIDAADPVIWPTTEDWARSWLAESRRLVHGPAVEFMNAALEQPMPGVTAALVVLADEAGGSETDLGAVGAGPLETLLARSGHGLLVLDDVTAAARRSTNFRSALGFVWLESNLPDEVRSLLDDLGPSPRQD